MFLKSTRLRLAALFALVLTAVVFSAVKFGPIVKADPESGYFAAKAGRPAEPVDLFAVTSATKTVSPAGNANPGDTLTYTVTINNGPATVNGVILSDTIDPNTTLVGGSVVVSPIAVDDTYNTMGNVNISFPLRSGVV